MIDRRIDSPIRFTLCRGEAIELDLSALRSDAVVEVQCGVSVVARRDSTSENAARLRIDWSVIERLGVEPSLLVFVSTPTVEHGRTLAVASLPERYAQLDLRLHDPRAMDWVSAIAPALVGAVTLVEALLAVGRSSAGRTAFSLGCGVVSIALLARWGAVIARKAGVRTAWRWAGLAATATALLPYFIGVRELRIGQGLLPTIDERVVLVSRASRTGAAASPLTEVEQLLPRRSSRWSARWLRESVVQSPSGRFVLTDARSARRLGIERYVRCARPDRCVFDAQQASAWPGVRIAPPVLEGASSAHRVALEGRLERLAIGNRRSFFARRDDERQPEVLTSFAPAGELRYMVTGEFDVVVQVSGAAGAQAITHAFEVPSFEQGRFAVFGGEDIDRVESSRSIVIMGIAPPFARADAPFESPDEAREFLVDHRDAPNPNVQQIRWHSKLFATRSDPRVDDPPIEVPSNATIVGLRSASSSDLLPVGAARCPDSVDEQREMHVLSRVYGLPSERGLAIAPLEESERDVGGWTPFDRRDAADYATVCHVLRGESLPRAQRAFGPIAAVHLVVRPRRVAVGSLVRAGPPRIATLVPRYRSARVAVAAMVGRFTEFAGFDLRFE